MRGRCNGINVAGAIGVVEIDDVGKRDDGVVDDKHLPESCVDGTSKSQV